MNYDFSPALQDRIQNLRDIRYTLLDNGIHQFEILNGSRNAVDEIFDLLLDLHNARIDKRQRLKLLYISGIDKELPVNRVISRTRQDKEKWGTLSYGANLVANKTLANIILRMLQPLGLGSPNDTRFYNLDEVDAAIEWLLSCPEYGDGETSA